MKATSAAAATATTSTSTTKQVSKSMVLTCKAKMFTLFYISFTIIICLYNILHLYKNV